MMQHTQAPTNATTSITASGIVPAVLREPDAARYLGMSRAYLKKARIFGRGPTFVRVRRLIGYRVADLERWLDSHTVRPAA
ncbi:MAG: hypothetical protein NT151_09535 [Acidobacteria bacterium]|nr:hypothetical protein [Acidobacteriota bacterium]